MAVSGGTDSGVAAFLLKEQGWEVTAVFMRLGIEGQEESEAAARAVADDLQIEFQAIDISREFRREVTDYFVAAYRQGYTPNPCIRCNKLIKFERLFQAAEDAGCSHLATGHYARIIQEGERGYALYQAYDKKKDQSYFLYTLSQEKLRKTLFPLGELKKEKAIQISREYSLPVAVKESQDICFIHADHNSFLKKYLPLTEGPIRTIERETMGEHQGLYFYTLGQRRGINIGGSGPYYVVDMDRRGNILYVSRDKDDPRLYKQDLAVLNLNWPQNIPQQKEFRCLAKIRYNMEPRECLVRFIDNETWHVHFYSPIRAMAPGQSVVFYKGEKVLGGGEIERTF